jgi:autotransporter translocation and assembly factor TamB
VVAADLGLRAPAAGGTPRLDGAIAVVERLSLWAGRWPEPIIIPPARIPIENNVLRVADLTALTSGARADVTGTVRLDWAAPARSALSGTVRARVDGRGLGPWLPGNTDGAGAASVDGKVGGALGAPHVQAQVAFQSLTVGWPDAPFEVVRLDGPVTVDGRAVTVGPLLAQLQTGGWLRVSGPGGRGSGRATLAGNRSAPLPVSDVDLNLQAAGLKTSRPVYGLTLGGLSFNVRVTELNQSTLRVVGDVQLGHNFLQVSQLEQGAHEKKPSGAPAKHGPTLADRVWVHLRVSGPNDTVTIGVPDIPEVTLGASCLVEGPLRAPRINGVVKGTGLYSRAALTVADWFTPRHLRECDIGPLPQPR